MVMAGLIVLVITTLIYFAFIDIKSTKEDESISVPYDYHVVYDDDGKLLILPKEYHFTTDDKGKTFLTK